MPCPDDIRACVQCGTVRAIPQDRESDLRVDFLQFLDHFEKEPDSFLVDQATEYNHMLGEEIVVVARKRGSTKARLKSRVRELASAAA